MVASNGREGRQTASAQGKGWPPWRLGLDVGSVNVKGVLLENLDGAEEGSRGNSGNWRWCMPSRGEPLLVVGNILAELSERVGQNAPLGLAVTGAGKTLLAGLSGSHVVNEVVAVTRAVSLLHPEVRTIIDIGGQFTKWVLVAQRAGALEAGRVEDFALNGLCAAGSGAFLEQQAGRLQVSLEELGRLAAEAPRGATIAGRCSVFAKSDMIHLQQRGTPKDEIAYGLCLALARTFASTVLKGRQVEPPVALVGGGAANHGLVRAFGAVLGLRAGELFVPEDYVTTGAYGAALDSAEIDPRSVQEWIDRIRHAAQGDTARVVLEGGEEPEELQPLSPPDRGAPPAEEPNLADLGLETGPVRGYLGVDVGSVSTNVVLLDEQQRLVLGVYLPTRGAPVEVLDEALGRLSDRFGDRLQVLGVGTTGSGRYLAEQLLGADIVKNEITAQLVSSAHFVPEVDTIFEIGGQDSKYIDAAGGRMRDFEMNKICAAGTGSFLEEQAQRLGVAIRGEFADRALASRHPRDLGTRCTVFMDAELVRAQAQGASVEDLCAGLAYSVARNYLEKVVAGRPIGETVVFQGGTASNDAVVAAFGQILGRPVRVHPYNRVSGAIGMALLAAEHQARTGAPSRFRGYGACRDHRVQTFECKGCENRCEVSRVRAGGRTAHFGDVCEKYTARDRFRQARVDGGEPVRSRAARPAHDRVADDLVARALETEDLFSARTALLEAHLPVPEPEATGARPRVGLVRATVSQELLPLWSHLLYHLGMEPVISPSTTADMLSLGGRGLPAEVCLPLKVAAGHVWWLLSEGGVDRVLLPAMLQYPHAQPADRSFPCLYAQSLPDMVALEAGERILRPQAVLLDDAGSRLETAQAFAAALGVSERSAREALEVGLEQQRAFERARRELGRRALVQGVPGGRGVLVLGRPYNLYDAFANLNLARHLRRLGLFALPVDLVPDPPSLGQEWYLLPWHFNREQVRAVHWAARHPQLYALQVSSFGCGPDAFTTKHLERLMGSRPRLLLEFDEHRGEAGLITRLEAFLDEIETHWRVHAGEAADEVPLGPRVHRTVPVLSHERARRVFMPNVEGHVHAFAGVLRMAGMDVTILPPADEESARMGEEFSTGRECHPYALIAGEMVRLARSERPRPGDVFFSPGTRIPCLMPQYGDGWRMVRDRLGSPLEIWDPWSGEIADLVGLGGLGRLYEGLTAIDLLLVAGCLRRPRERVPGAVDAVLAECFRDVEETIACGSRLNRFDPRGDMAACVARSMDRLASVDLAPPEPRPVVGVTGDLYTRVNRAGNGDLFHRLEAMGCTVWPSPFFGAMADFEAPQDVRRAAGRGEVGKALSSFALGLLQLGVRDRMVAALEPDLRPFCVEPPSQVLQRAAERYVNSDTSHLVREVVAKMVDFARRGAHGVIVAAGLGCMVGVSASATIPAIRRDHDNLPMVALFYGSHEGPSQRIQVETFVHQVRAYFEQQQGASPR